MKYPEIHSPRGSIIVEGSVKATLTWNEGAFKQWNERFSNVQIFVDSEVYRLCEPYTPKRTGMLVMSGELGTDFGQGFVEWIAPYAAPQYYMHNKIGSELGPLRGPFWFERMKEVHVNQIIDGAKAMVGSS